MPAGPEQQNPVPGWTDYPSFRIHVIRECQRLGAPWPDDDTLGREYIHRRITLAHLAAVDEVAAWNERQRREAVNGR